MKRKAGSNRKFRDYRNQGVPGASELGPCSSVTLCVAVPPPYAAGLLHGNARWHLSPLVLLPGTQDRTVVCCLYSHTVQGIFQPMLDTQQAMIGGGLSEWT